MKRIMRWFILLCAAMCVLSLAACGNGEINTAAGKSDSANKTDVSGKEEVLDKGETSGKTEQYTPVNPAAIIASEEGDFVYELNDGIATVTGYTGTAEQVRIPDSLGGSESIVIGAGAFEENETTTYVYLPQTVQEIELDAFHQCKNLEEVSFPSSLTVIGQEAFLNCHNLRIVDLADTSVERIGNHAFAGCDSLVSVALPATLVECEDYNDRGLGICVFEGCSKLATMTVAPENPILKMSDNILYMGTTAVYLLGSDARTELILQNGTTGVFKFAFSYNDRITSVALPDSITDIGRSAFMHCTSLEQIDLGEGLQRIDTDAFYGCAGLREVSIPASCIQIEDKSFYETKNAIFTYKGQEYRYEQMAELTAAISAN